MGVTFMVPLRNTLRASLAKQSEDMTGGLAGLQGCASVIWEGRRNMEKADNTQTDKPRPKLKIVSNRRLPTLPTLQQINSHAMHSRASSTFTKTSDSQL